MKLSMLDLQKEEKENDAGDARRFLFSIIYVCKSIVVFYVLSPISLLGY